MQINANHENNFVLLVKLKMVYFCTVIYNVSFLSGCFRMFYFLDKVALFNVCFDVMYDMYIFLR